MNDNHHPHAMPREQRHGALRDSDHLAELGDIATRAITKPESLTMGEIQEIGWGFLVASRIRPDAVSEFRTRR